MTNDSPPTVTNLLVFDDFLQAARNGFYTKTHWKKLGRRPCNNESAIVVTKRYKSVLPVYAPILEVVSSEIVVVAHEYFFVFSFQETECSHQQKSKQENAFAVHKTPDSGSCTVTSTNSNSLPPSPPPLPYDVRSVTSSSPVRRSGKSSREHVFMKTTTFPKGWHWTNCRPN